MCSGAEIAFQVLFICSILQNFRRRAVAVLPDKRIDTLIFAEFFQSRSQYNQFAAVGNRHPCAINRLIAEPRGLELMRIQKYDNFLERLIQHFEIHFQRERCGFFETLLIVSDIEAFHNECTDGIFPHHC